MGHWAFLKRLACGKGVMAPSVMCPGSFRLLPAGRHFPARDQHTTSPPLPNVIAITECNPLPSNMHVKLIGCEMR